MEGSKHGFIDAFHLPHHGRVVARFGRIDVVHDNAGAWFATTAAVDGAPAAA